MKHLFSIGALALGMGLAASAQATPIVTVGGTAVAGEGQMSSIAGVATIDFNAPFTLPAGITCTGCTAALYTGSTANVSAAPPGDTSQYLSVGVNRTPVTITLSSSANYIGFYAASLDVYNSIEFIGATTTKYTGTDLATLAGVAANGNQGRGFYFNVQEQGNDFTAVRLSSTRNAFELDNFAVGRAQLLVPEPGSLALFGLSILGLAGLKRRSK